MRLKYSWLILFLLLFTVPFSISARRRGGGRGGSSVKNIFTHGGVIENWVLLMPVKKEEVDSLDSTGTTKIYRDQLISSELFDSSGRLRSRNIGLPSGTLSHTVKADSLGWISPEQEPYQFYYAYSNIEAHVSEKVRLFVMGRGVFRIWLNGNELTKGIGTATGDEPIYFDGAFKQGDNSLLILFLPDGKNSFLLEAYPKKRALVPFKKRLDNIEIVVDPYSLGSKVLKGTFKFNIPIPQNSFYTNLTLSTDSDTVGSVFRVLDSVVPGDKFTFDVPPNYNGVIKLSARTELSTGKRIESNRFIWIGDLGYDFKRLDSLTNELSNTLLENVNFTLPLHKYLIESILRWNKNWYTKKDSCITDIDIRELGYIKIGCLIAKDFFAKRRFPKGASFPILTDGKKDTTIIDNHYDHVKWLNYKYPEIYKNSDDKSKKGYEAWVTLPSSIYRKKKKIDIIFYLHDIKICDRQGISCIRGEGPNLFNKKKSIVISPLSDGGILWEERELANIIQNLSKSGRTKRIFITGEGMGGFESVNQLIHHPDDIAAGLILNAFSTDDDLCKLKNSSLWIFHGNNNKIVPVENSLNMVNDLKECGIRGLKFSVFSEDGDKIGPIVYEDEATYKWLFRQ